MTIWRCVWCHALLPGRAERCHLCELLRDMRQPDTESPEDTGSRATRIPPQFKQDSK